MHLPQIAALLKAVDDTSERGRATAKAADVAAFQSVFSASQPGETPAAAQGTDLPVQLGPALAGVSRFVDVPAMQAETTAAPLAAAQIVPGDDRGGLALAEHELAETETETVAVDADTDAAPVANPAAPDVASPPEAPPLLPDPDGLLLAGRPLPTPGAMPSEPMSVEEGPAQVVVPVRPEHGDAAGKAPKVEATGPAKTVPTGVAVASGEGPAAPGRPATTPAASAPIAVPVAATAITGTASATVETASATVETAGATVRTAGATVRTAGATATASLPPSAAPVDGAPVPASGTIPAADRGGSDRPDGGGSDRRGGGDGARIDKAEAPLPGATGSAGTVDPEHQPGRTPGALDREDLTGSAPERAPGNGTAQATGPGDAGVNRKGPDLVMAAPDDVGHPRGRRGATGPAEGVDAPSAGDRTQGDMPARPRAAADTAASAASTETRGGAVKAVAPAAGESLFGTDPAMADAALGEARASARSPAAAPLPILQAPDTPRQVAMQIAEVLRASGERAVELRLQPEELGRVQMTLSQDATGTLTVVLNVERADTLDLLRRNIDLLGADLRDLGYDSIDFSFQGDGASGRHGGRSSADDRPGRGDTSTKSSGLGTVADAAGRRGASGDGIDLRL